ncbi:MAG: radical SAM protein [Thermoplasmata archaeon]|uniref:7-carboxy-7-deazaguanine synthase n=1 Tax=Candidatus Sysuiplasma superficiale TaxID=2823368 RepID=A0A8J8CCA5_9ARCH|nr:radical SAM protein [Candidatus Sysuiplasma superficiale]MBX8643361.1 radical SAM protein [Candidatus Sysuiplasma superficiale]MCL4347210.1 7-carboxy-7-deazaguanine synthase QueE [Candidatus Thermoplasmatota archaeon]
MKINEIFESIQGEGLLVGLPTLFIRTAGCDLRCVWCDTPYALLESQGTEWSVDELVTEAKRHRVRDICITGGDPLRQKEEVVLLISRLLGEGFRIVLETSGAYPIDGLPRSERLVISMDVKLPGSGMEGRNMLENIDLLRKWDQLKLIIADRNDYEYARKLLSGCSIPCEVIMTPAGGRELKWLAERVLSDGLAVRVLPQMHKYIWGDERGR